MVFTKIPKKKDGEYYVKNLLGQATRISLGEKKLLRVYSMRRPSLHVPSRSNFCTTAADAEIPYGVGLQSRSKYLEFDTNVNINKIGMFCKVSVWIELGRCMKRTKHFIVIA